MTEMNEPLKRAVESLDRETEAAVNHVAYLKAELEKAELTVLQTRAAAAAIRKSLSE